MRRWGDDRWLTLCEAKGPNCDGKAVHAHHRKLRSQGGDNSRENLCGVCMPCHGHIHANPGRSYETGLMVHGWDDPADIPVRGLGLLR